jgi:3',5'-cyclic-AMP phosphodiesterase
MPKGYNMIRFIYMADSHLGANPMGYQQQPGYAKRMPELVEALSVWMEEHGPIDFIIHGGDMIDDGAEVNICAAAEYFDLAVPVFLCLGNHDEQRLESVESWLSMAPDFFPAGQPACTLDCGDALIHVVPNHWEARPYYWDEEQTAQFHADQLAELEEALADEPDMPHILCTHSPAYAIPPEQTGLAEPFHVPPQGFTDTVAALAKAHPCLKLVLSAHSHINSCQKVGGVRYVTTSSFAETPFEFRVIEIDSGSLKMTTESLLGRVTFDAPIDASKPYVMGSPEARTLQMKS